MADRNQNRVDAGWQSENDELGRELDAALAKYSNVAARAGLEDRILANLHAEAARVPERTWWRWSFAGALAAVIVVALALAWRSGKPAHPVVTIHPSTATQSTKEPATQAVSNSEENGVRPTRPGPAHKVAAHRSSPPVMASAQPKFDHFPSPRPLSEEEQLLVRYVQEFPQEAVMMAKVQAESEKEIEQLIRNQPPREDSEQQQEQQER